MEILNHDVPIRNLLSTSHLSESCFGEFITTSSNFLSSSSMILEISKLLIGFTSSLLCLTGSIFLQLLSLLVVPDLVLSIVVLFLHLAPLSPFPTGTGLTEEIVRLSFSLFMKIGLSLVLLLLNNVLCLVALGRT